MPEKNPEIGRDAKGRGTLEGNWGLDSRAEKNRTSVTKQESEEISLLRRKKWTMYNIRGVSKNFKKSQRSSSVNDLRVNSFSETVQGGSHIAMS